MTRGVRHSLWPLAALLGLAFLALGSHVQAVSGHAMSQHVVTRRAATRYVLFRQAARPAHRAATATLTVFAAASLQEAFTTIAAQFKARYGAVIRFNFGGSDTLATQIIQGAPADVFASANLAQMKVVQNSGLIATATPPVFVRNRLTVIVPRSNPAHVYSLPDLGQPHLRLVLAEPAVPVGKYARAAFAVMASDAAFGPDFLARIRANTVSLETDVKAVAAKVVLGEADAGVVYVTDVTAQVAPRVTEIAIPAPYNQIAQYPIAVVKGSHNAALAQQFVQYVLSPAGQSVLHRAGFITSAPPGGYASSFQVTGLVTQTMTLTAASLRKMPATSLRVTLRSDKGVLGTATYTGALLNSVVQAAIPLTNTSYKNDMLRQFVVVGASDGYEVTVSMAEILPQFGHQPVLLAYAKNGKPLGADEGAVELIVPGDNLAGRDVRNVTRVVVGEPLESS